MNRIKFLIETHKKFVIYFLISCFVTLIDIAICRVSESFVDKITANTLGVVTGFVIQYVLTSRHVYNRNDFKALIVFFSTFLMGLGVANFIIWILRDQLFNGREDFIIFFFSKGMSIVIPFFLMYIVRKKLMERYTK